MDVPLTIGMPVATENGRAGRLEMIIVDQDSKQPTYLVIRRSPPYFPGRVVVPTRLVSEVAEGTVRHYDRGGNDSASQQPRPGPEALA